jgi:DNA (cytosine-5)-methyltransferase 1
VNVVSLFAGCGGSSEGWKAAGFDVRAAVEWDDHAADTYALNAPGAAVLRRDVTDVAADEILEAAGLAELDVLDGSPPCQSWSMSGKRRMGADPRGLLFREYVRLVRELRPRAFVAENVEGMTLGVARVTLSVILRDLRAAGYSVHAKVLDARWLGVPQTRRRVVILGLRNDLDRDAREWFPEPRPTLTTIADALPHVARIVRLGRPLTATPQWRDEESFSADRAGPTLTANGLGDANRDSIRIETLDGELRRPTFAELLAYSGFRSDFRIEGTLAKQWERLGNSVPPPMMRAVAERVVAALA